MFSSVNSHPPSFATSLVLAPHSVSKRVLVFRVSDWNDTNYCFRFHQGQVLEGTLTYQRIPPKLRSRLWEALRVHVPFLRSRLSGEVPRVHVPLEPNLPMIEGTNDIRRYSADYISLLRGSRAVNPDGSIKDIPEKTLSKETIESPCPPR